MAITYLKDVLPLFTDTDKDCMAAHQPPVLLGDKDWICRSVPAWGFPDHGNARRVHERLKDGTMPPGSPWSDTNVKIYEEWMAQGFQA